MTSDTPWALISRPQTITIICSTVVAVLVIIRYLYGGIATKWFTLGSPRSCNHCRDRVENYKKRVIYIDNKRDRHKKKRNEASAALRTKWFIKNFVNVFKEKNPDIKKDVTDTTEYMQFRAMLYTYERKQKEIANYHIAKNGLDSVFIEGWVPGYLQSKQEDLLSKTLDWFDTHFKEYGIRTVEWSDIRAALNADREYFYHIIRKFFLECIIITLEHIVIEQFIIDEDRPPEPQELVDLFKERWKSTQPQVFKEFIKE